MANEWRDLIKILAGDKFPCNCGEAYYSFDFPLSDKNSWWERLGLPGQPKCQYGCQANQFNVKNEVAKRIFEALGGETQARDILSVSLSKTSD